MTILEHREKKRKKLLHHLLGIRTVKQMNEKDCDAFMTKYLEALKNKFVDEQEYSGRIVRLEIDGMIRRMQ